MTDEILKKIEEMEKQGPIEQVFRNTWQLCQALRFAVKYAQENLEHCYYVPAREHHLCVLVEIAKILECEK